MDFKWQMLVGLVVQTALFVLYEFIQFKDKKWDFTATLLLYIADNMGHTVWVCIFEWQMQ